MAFPAPKPAQKGNLNHLELPSSNPSSKHTLTIKPDGNFFFAQETKKNIIIAAGQSKPSVMDRIMKASEAVIKPKPTPNQELGAIAKEWRKVIGAHQPSEAEAAQLRLMYSHSAAGYFRACSHAARMSPPVFPIGVVAMLATGAGLTCWLTGGREIVDKLVNNGREEK